MKYKTKPVIVEAEQWTEGKIIPGVCTNNCLNMRKETAPNLLEQYGFPVDKTLPKSTPPHIHSKGGILLIHNGDYILKDPDGDLYTASEKHFLEKHVRVE